MKISLSEIWNFLDLIGQDEKGWSYTLHAGEVNISDINHDTLNDLRNDDQYDTELLPSIFTFREILWQPDVFTEAQMSLPSVRILKAFCEEYVDSLGENPTPVQQIYIQLILGLAAHCEQAITELEKKNSAVSHTLGLFRTHTFPILKFFVYHPKNRLDYYRDAVNRLNYAVKIMLTQFNGRYTELKDPYWIIGYSNGTAAKQDKPKSDKQTTPEQE